VAAVVSGPQSLQARVAGQQKVVATVSGPGQTRAVVAAGSRVSAEITGIGPQGPPGPPGGPVTGLPGPPPVTAADVGFVYYDTTTDMLMCWNGVGWEAVALLPPPPYTGVADGEFIVWDSATASFVFQPPAPPLFPAYRHMQATPATVWTVIHNLGFRPNVTVVDSGGTEVIGNVHYVDDNTVQLTFSAAFGGEAYLS
jgi:hypothetical protein